MAATVAEWVAFAADRGDTIANDAASAAALVRASDYIARFYTNRLTRTAPEDVTDKATYIAAGFELATPGFFSKTFTPDQQKVLTKAGDIQWTARGNASGADAATPISTSIEALFHPYMRERGAAGLFLGAVGR